MTAWLAALAAALVVAMIVLIGLFGWAGVKTRLERIGLFMMGAGLLWAGPARLMGQGVSLGDLVFVVGLALHLWALYGRAMVHHADALDGQIDGQITVMTARTPRQGRER